MLNLAIASGCSQWLMLYLKLQLLETNSYLRKENGGIFGLVVYFEQFPISLCFLVELEILTVYTF